MSLPSIAVIIPTRNRHGFLKTAVDSVLAQSLPAREIIVADDGEGARAALAGLSPVLSVLDNRKRGPVPARILGVSQATSDLIAFLDDDDWFSHADHLADAARSVSAGADLVFSDGVLVFEDGSPAEPFAFDADARSLEANNTILISAVTYRRALHDTLGGFDAALPYYWDWDWYLRVARSGAKLIHIPRPSVSIRVHAQSMSGADQEAARRANLDLFSKKHGLPFIPLKNHVSLAREAGR